MKIVQSAPAPKAPRPSELWSDDKPLVLVDKRFHYFIFRRPVGDPYTDDPLTVATGYDYENALQAEAKPVSGADADKLAAKMRDTADINRENRDKYKKMQADVEAVEKRHRVDLWDEGADRENASEDGRVDEDYPEYWSRMIGSAGLQVRENANRAGIDIDKELGYPIS